MNMFRVTDIDDSQEPLLDHLIELRTRPLTERSDAKRKAAEVGRALQQ